MLIVMISFIICFLLVYTVRRQALDHAWKIAIAAGAVVNVVVVAGGNIAMGIHTEYGSLIIGSLVLPPAHLLFLHNHNLHLSQVLFPVVH